VNSIVFRRVWLALCLSLVTHSQASPAPLLSPNGEPGDRFGHAVATWDDLAVVGAPGHDDLGEDSGAAYVYRRDCADWVFVQELLANGGAAGDRFGSAVAMQGGLIVVGAEGRQSGRGAAYVYFLSGQTWLPAQTLLPDESTTGHFGEALATNGSIIAVGAPDDDEAATDAGAVYVFRESKGWFLEEKILADDGEAFDFFGNSVALSDDRLAVGSPFAFGDDSFAGAVYVFDFVGGAPVFDQKIIALDGNDGDGLGWSTAIRANTIIAGAPFDDAPPATDAGSVYEFENLATVWTQADKLEAPLPESVDRFGRAVTFNDDFLLVGAPLDEDSQTLPGVAHVFTRAALGWQFGRSITPNKGTTRDKFGWSVAVSGAKAIIGAPLDEDAGSGAGAVYTDYLGDVSPTDFDGDGDTDLTDFALIRNCITGPVAGDLEAVCLPADVDADGDVDLADFARLQIGVACAD